VRGEVWRGGSREVADVLGVVGEKMVIFWVMELGKVNAMMGARLGFRLLLTGNLPDMEEKYVGGEAM
jgi:hypothetical protein